MVTSHVARCSVLLLLCWITSIFGKDITESKLPYTEMLDDNYELSWNFNKTHTVFRTHVKTNGYIGFGFSSTGAMFPSDVIIGWVDDNGQSHFADRHATGFTVPTIDASQDWFLLNATESGEYTTLTMIREHETCDSEDMNVMEGTTRVIFSYFPTDPISDDDIPYHGPSHRGTRSLNLRHPTSLAMENDDLPSDAFTYDFRSHNYSLPSNDTTYAYRFIKMPHLDGKHHMIKVEPIIQEGHELLVHHIIILMCKVPFPDELDGFVYKDFTPNIPKEAEACDTIFFGWAIGGKGYIFPKHFGHSLGAPGDPKHFRLVIHYDNPRRLAGVVDSSGIRITLTKQIRQYDSALLQVGVTVHPYHIIPPFQENFLISGVCSPECLAQSLGDEEIHFIGGLLHSHLLGRKARVRHIRNGTELPFLVDNESYDFNFQELVLYDEERTLKKGDWLLMECEYDSSQRTKVTYGGPDTLKEMCVGFLLYYPRISLGDCRSFPMLGQTSPFPNMSFLADIDTRDWNNSTNVVKFEKSLEDSDLYHKCHGTSEPFEFNGRVAPKPNITKPYIPPKSSCSKS